MPYHELSSEKYWQESVNQEIKQLRAQKNREAFQTFRNILFAGIVTVGVGYAIHTMPLWISTVFELMEYYGVIPTYIPAQ